MNQRWDSYFLDLALRHAAMSKDPNTKVGAVIVGADNQILSSGWNGFPRGIADDHRLFDRETKLQLIVHGEMNAIMNAVRTGVSLRNSTLYLACTDLIETWGGPPCTRCTVHIIQAGIDSVVSIPQKVGPSKWHTDLAVARGLLDEGGVTYREVDWP